MELDLVDVFCTGALTGNPLAVVRGGDALGDAAMAALARWLGFSETTFLLSPSDPGADYRVRIFTPTVELPFAGHPTLGSCAAWLAAGGVPRRAATVVQQCAAGLIDIAGQGDSRAFKAPPMRNTAPLSPAERDAALALARLRPDQVLDAVHADNGPKWQLLRLASAAEVLAVEPAARAPAGTDIGIIGPWPAGGAAQWEVRAFFTGPTGALTEDPVTGSFNAGVAEYLFRTGLARGAYVAAQGRKTGGDGRVEASIDGDGAVWIGGRSAIIARGAALARWSEGEG